MGSADVAITEQDLGQRGRLVVWLYNGCWEPSSCMEHYGLRLGQPGPESESCLATAHSSLLTPHHSHYLVGESIFLLPPLPLLDANMLFLVFCLSFYTPSLCFTFFLLLPLPFSAYPPQIGRASCRESV